MFICLIFGQSHRRATIELVRFSQYRLGEDVHLTVKTFTPWSTGHVLRGKSHVLRQRSLPNDLEYFTVVVIPCPWRLMKMHLNDDDVDGPRRTGAER